MKAFLLSSTFCLVLIRAPFAAAADNEWECSREGLTRNVLLLYPQAPQRVPCRVYYAKPDENVLPKVLWDARSEEGYCERKADEFLAKLESWGWQCEIKETSPNTTGVQESRDSTDRGSDSGIHPIKRH